MADTGSEIAEGTSRDTQGIVSRMLERQFLMRGKTTPANAGKGATTPQGATNIEIGVRCPEGDVDARANELLRSLERMDVRATCTIEGTPPTITLGVRPDERYQALRALELLSTDRRSSFSINDIDNVEALEAIAGRRALGRSRADDAAATAASARSSAEPIESVALTFSNHPDDPTVDAREAREYASRMRELGFDAAHRPVTCVRRDVDGSLRRQEAEVVGVSYLTGQRDDFLTASGIALHEVGVTVTDDPYSHDRAAYVEGRDRLQASADKRKDAFERNRELASGATSRQNKAKTKVAGRPTAEEYLAMPPREQARIAPEDVPKAAFGSQTLATAAREQTAAARALGEGRSPSRTHPSIGER